MRGEPLPSGCPYRKRALGNNVEAVGGIACLKERVPTCEVPQLLAADEPRKAEQLLAHLFLVESPHL